MAEYLLQFLQLTSRSGRRVAEPRNPGGYLLDGVRGKTYGEPHSGELAEW